MVDIALHCLRGEIGLSYTLSWEESLYLALLGIFPIPCCTSVRTNPILPLRPCSVIFDMFHFRTSFGSLGSPCSQDELQSPTGKAAEKLGAEEDEDSTYTTYHPRPIAVSSSRSSRLGSGWRILDRKIIVTRPVCPWHKTHVLNEVWK